MKHAEVTVNGKVVDRKFGDGIVVVLPPDVSHHAFERKVGTWAQSSWKDGTGTTTLIFQREHLGLESLHPIK